MAVVLEASRGEDGARRAIKLMLPLARAEEAAARFRREYRVLSMLNHPNVLRVFDAGTWLDRPWFAMELLEGLELRLEVERWRALPPTRRCDRAVAVLVQIASALEHIHAQGWVHRDVTPSNVMILPDGTARLMDFGVVKEPGAECTVAGEMIGTVAFMAPEQIRGEVVDARADLYSLGAVFYLMLTGRRPFNARTLAGYLDKHLHQDPRPPRELLPTLPKRLDDLCLRLLAKDPSDRFASATHLLHTLGVRHPPRPGDPPLLAGRTAERARLREQLALLEAGKGGVIVLEGERGMGCSRLVHDSARLARALGLPVSDGQNRSPDQPAFSGLRGIYEDISRSVAHIPHALEEIYGPASQVEPGGERVDLWSVCVSFRELLIAGGPRLVCVEDIDRADRGTLEVVEYLIRNLASYPLLFLLSRHPPADGEEDLLRGLVTGERTEVVVTHIALPPLSEAAVEEILLQRVDPEPRVAVLARRLQEEGQGNPFIIGEMIRGLLERGVLTPQHTIALSAAELESAPLPVPRSLQEALSARLAALTPIARRLLVLVAVARQEVDPGLLEEASSLARPVLTAAAERLLEAELIRGRLSGLEECFELAHPLLREALLAETSAEEQAQAHRSLGLALERRWRRNIESIVEQLAHHFDAGGVPAKAYPYLIQAAEKQLHRAFLSEALGYLDRAAQLAPLAAEFMPLVEADRRLADLVLRRASTLYHLGRWQEAREQALRADAVAQELGNDRLIARTAAELACQARTLHEFDEAEQQLARAIAHAKAAGDQRLQIVPLYERGAMRWANGDLERAREHFTSALSLSETFNDSRGLALGANGLGVLAMCLGQSAEARRYFEQAIEVCERSGLIERLAIARTNLAELSHCTGNLLKGFTLADRTITEAREVHHRYGMALGLRYRALLLGDLGRYPEAEENAAEAMRIQKQLGNLEEELAAGVALIRVVLVRGNLHYADQLVTRCLELAQRYDTEGYLPVVRAWKARLLAACNQREEAIAELQAAEGAARSWPHQRLRQLLNAARAYQQIGRPREASDLAEASLRIADSCGYRYYAMRARQILAKTLESEAAVSRHGRVAEALARSISANLPPEDAASFLQMQGLKPMPFLQRRLRTRS